MQKKTVSIALDRESLTRFARLLSNHSLAAGAHCSGDDEDADADGVSDRFCGAAALEARCGDNVEG